MPGPIIQSIESLRNLPIFPDDQAVSESPRLRKHTLVYGFNGCGKTTLSRVFACLGTGKLHTEWESSGSFSIRLTNGTLVSSDLLDEQLQQRILVFNSDFISENFRWHQGQANPIFYISREQKDLSEQVDQKAARILEGANHLQWVRATERKSDQAFMRHKRTSARNIADELGLGRLYVATHLESDYKDYSYAAHDHIDELTIKAKKQVLNQEAPLPKLSQIALLTDEFSSLIESLPHLLQTTLGTISIDELRKHDKMLRWVKDGLDYHTALDLQSCLFCGNQLTADRIALLEAAIDDRFDKLIGELTRAKESLEALDTSLSETMSSLPSTNDLVGTQRDHFNQVASAFRTSLKDGRNAVKRVIDLLTDKLGSPNSKIAPDSLNSLGILEKWSTSYCEQRDAVNKVIDAHNTAHDDFAADQAASKDALKRHYLAEGHDDYHDLATELSKSTRVRAHLEKREARLLKELNDLKQQMRQHGPAADRISSLVCKYLGHSELAIVTKDEGYEIHRHGKVATAAPSEGEKTAIALSYFIVLLEADGRHRDELIVVMDDPISSLDTRSLNYACSLIRSLENAAQLIVLTHNAYVMNEVKKWLRNRTERELRKGGNSGDDATAALLYIDTIQPSDKESRSSRIVELPKHLRGHESDYHYLFHMILRFVASEEDRSNYLFVMPNVLRRVLEVFLAFKLPGSEGLTSKIGKVAQQAEDIGIDELRIRALERLTHVESHGDNIDHLVSTSSMTIEEAKDAAEALLELVAKMDSEHSRHMRNHCRVAN